jgi:RNA polymerase sigma factor (sigma-70 family)
MRDHTALPTATPPAAADDAFFDVLVRAFEALRPRPSLVDRLRERAAAIAADLARRARRRRAQFDLFLREAPPAHVADLALAVKAQQGNRDAVLELRQRLEPVVLRRIYAYNLGWNEEELTELVFDRIWDRLPQYRGDGSLRGWAGTVTFNVLKNWIRAEDARPQMVAVEHPDRAVAYGARVGVEEAFATRERPDVALETLEHEARLRDVVARIVRVAQRVLSESDWALLQRQIVDGVSYQALSTESGRTEGALRKRRFDALKKLRAALLADYGPDFLDRLQELLQRPTE